MAISLSSFIVCLVSLSCCVDVCFSAVPASLLLGLWPLNQQFGERDLSIEGRDASNAGEVVARPGSHFMQWTGTDLSYISVPAVPGKDTSGYVHIYAEIIIDSATYTPGQAQQVLHLGDEACSLRAYFLDGALYLELHSGGVTTFVSHPTTMDSLKMVYLEYNVCSSGQGRNTINFDCLAITDALTYSYDLEQITDGSFCPNLYSAADVGRIHPGSDGLRGTVSCLAFYTGRIEDNDYYPDETPTYIHNSYCTGK